MTVTKLIQALSKMNPDAIVTILDCDASVEMPVTGMVYRDNEVILQSDENAEIPA